jgi:hypothetical protein
MTPYIGSHDTPRFVSLADYRDQDAPRQGHPGQPVGHRGRRSPGDATRAAPAPARGDGVDARPARRAAALLRRRVRRVGRRRPQQPTPLGRRRVDGRRRRRRRAPRGRGRGRRRGRTHHRGVPRLRGRAELRLEHVDRRRRPGDRGHHGRRDLHAHLRAVDDGAAARQPAGEPSLDPRARRPAHRAHGHDLFDALYALAHAEARENSVDAISDFAFNDGLPMPLPARRLLRDRPAVDATCGRATPSYAVAISASPRVDPTRAKQLARAQDEPPRDGDSPQIVQDTGTGGSYPCRPIASSGRWPRGRS